MTFASAWTLLVCFFVQLVGVALGTGTSTSPTGMLILQTTAYVVYLILIATYFWNPVASVLLFLYALLCCIYATLFGTTLYVCPRLLMLLQPSLVRHSGLAIRLAACSVMCVLVFGARTFGFVQKVMMAPPQNNVVSWWWQYGALELLPAVLFLIMMHPSNSSTSGNSTTTTSNTGRHYNSSSAASTPSQQQRNHHHRRQGSQGSGSKKSGESAPLVVHKPANTVSVYGTSTMLPNSSSSGD
jgi:glucan phosphoethanolaminetransferase (alkaline phosphatase superfamily)